MTTEQETLERLTALAPLARWTDEAEPVTVGTEPWCTLPVTLGSPGSLHRVAILLPGSRPYCAFLDDERMPAPRYTQPLVPIGRGAAIALSTTGGMLFCASVYLYGRSEPGDDTLLLGLGGVLIALAAILIAGLAVGTAPLNAKDHLRSGERRRLIIRIIAATVAAFALVVWPIIARDTPFPLPLAAVQCAVAGVLIMIAQTSYLRIQRDGNRRGCNGSYDNCLTCDTANAALDLHHFLQSVDQKNRGNWLIDPATGKELYLAPDGTSLAEHVVDDTGRDRKRIYILGRLPGRRSLHLTGVTVYDDGPVPAIKLQSVTACEALSIDREGIEALHVQLERTITAEAPRM